MHEKTINKNPNNLINENSPYLLQHAYNPVNWNPWCEEAFKKAKDENKPIFLSIGYSTCHWCHVMEKESFEDEEVAKLLNDFFIPIKVDREERPDLDHIYMLVCQIMTKSGGWPLTVFLTPEKKPFFAGTYFPKSSKYGRIGMLELLSQVSHAWKEKNKEIYDSSDYIVNFIKQQSSTEKHLLNPDLENIAYKQFLYNFDPIKGGFGSAPKFPTPQNLLFLLRYFKTTNEKNALKMVEKTLQEMYFGGMFDHVGFGFHRYSTDKNWILPHFEKMLYDQAMLLIAYSEAFQLTKNVLYKEIAEKITTYLMRDLLSPEGGFYSAEDADSEGEEGKFYTWTKDEIKEILKEDTELFIKTFNIKDEGNFEEESTREKNKQNILFLESEIPTENKEKINKLIETLFLVRKKRVHPYKDNKILTDWNGLIIAALAIAGRVFNKNKYIETAENCFNFISTKMKDINGFLLHSYREGIGSINGYLDDYSFLIFGLIELYESTLNEKYILEVNKLNDILLKHFLDKENGGFYFISDFSEELIVRKKEIYDGAIPSGNSITFLNLLKLSKITGDNSLLEYAENLKKSFSDEINSSPHAFAMFLCGNSFSRSNSEIVLVGELENALTQEMLLEVNKRFIPNKVLIVTSEDNSIFSTYQNYKKNEDRTTAYICKNSSCLEPTNNLLDFCLRLDSI